MDLSCILTGWFNSLLIAFKTVIICSYLGNGLIAARLGIVSLLGETSSNNLKTHCLPKNIMIKDWIYAGNVYHIAPADESSFENCYSQAKFFIEKVTNVSQIHNINDFPIFAFSYFYDRGLQAGLLHTEPKTKGGWIQIQQYKLAAEEACKMKPDEVGSEHWRPWMCLDLTYIYTLLTTGYGLSDDKSIHVSCNINHTKSSIYCFFS